MNRFWLSVGVMVLGLGLPGCWRGEEITSPEVVSEEVVLTGTLQSLSNAGFSDKVTHLLRTPEDTIYTVYSEEVDLFDLQWEDVLVEVTGELFPPEEEGNKPVIRIDSLTLAPSEVESEEVDSFEGYENDVFGFSMSYPSDWALVESSTLVTFSSPPSSENQQTDTILISKRPNAQSLSVEAWFLEYGVLETSEAYALGAIGPDQIPVVKVSEESTLTYYIQDADQILVLSFTSVLEEEALSHENLFNALLYSFDLWSDGIRTSEASDEASPETESASGVELSEDQASVMEILLRDFEEGSIVKLSFVAPNYVYVDYSTEDSEAFMRQLLSYSESYDFTTVATFEAGEFTDWELVSGDDAAKGKASLEVDPMEGTVVLIPEGYSSLESASLSFQMAYPSAWYYSRSGDFYYFGKEPADASNALITLELVEGSSLYEVLDSEATWVIRLPRDDSSHFELSGAADYEEELLAMAGSFQVLP